MRDSVKKIGFIISSLSTCGGEERVVTLIANELSRYYEVTIYTYESRKLEHGKRNDYVLSKEIRVEEIPYEDRRFWSKCVRLAYAYTGLTRGPVSAFLLREAFYPGWHLDEWEERIRQEQFDLLIAVSGTNSILLGYLADRISVPCISWEHSSFEGYFDRRTGYYKNREDVYRKYVGKLRTRVVLNEDIAGKYREHLGLTTHVIPNPKSFSSPQKADLSARCFVTCGRLETEKAYDDMIEAFALFADRKQDWTLRIIGGGRLEQSLRELAEQKGLSDRVIITGYTNEVAENLLQGSAFLMTSRWEGFPMTVTEALEVGLPVVAYGIPAMQPLVTDRVEGRIVPPFDREKFAQAMLQLAEDAELRRSMSANAVAKAQTLEPERIVRMWVKLIEEITGGNL